MMADDPKLFGLEDEVDVVEESSNGFVSEHECSDEDGNYFDRGSLSDGLDKKAEDYSEGSQSPTVSSGDELDISELLHVKSKVADDIVGEFAAQPLQSRSLYSIQDIAMLDFGNIQTADVPNYNFVDLSIAFDFYNKFARLYGFSVRKSRIRRNKAGDVVQQTFVCFKQGWREPKFYQMENRVRKAKKDTRCGCLAKLRVDLDIQSGKWFVSEFSNEHNHDLIGGNLSAMLRSQKKMTIADIEQIHNMRKAGISIPHIYGLLAAQSGGYENVGYRIQDIYNQLHKEKRMQMGDARSALRFLHDMKKTDPTIFSRHVLDDGGVLKHLFWCDGISQLDYQLFGDVLAFDATYRRNKYHCPLVVFSGVNHHDQSIVFASALVADETEETYVWVLERLLEAMQGKSPVSVITDGDLSMRNAIRRVLPHAHHRLCAWHLLRNATSNVSNPRFTWLFKKCMLGDYEVVEFTRHWDAMVQELGLQDHHWVNELYEKRKMWASAHMRGMFFAGFRTTSRCEGLHAMLGKFVLSRHNFLDFLQHFQRCLSHIRFKEAEADFESSIGNVVLQTQFPELERHASNVYTSQIFEMFRSMLIRASAIFVVGERKTACSCIYMVAKYRKPETLWHVSHYHISSVFKCSCKRMESIGIPCDHILAVLVNLHLPELPKSLIMNRWTKKAKSSFQTLYNRISGQLGSLESSRYGCMSDLGRDLYYISCKREDFFLDTREKLLNDILLKKQILAEENNLDDDALQCNDTIVRDPVFVRSKGCGNVIGSGSKRMKRSLRCSVCKREGHNKKTCNVVNVSQLSQSISGVNSTMELHRNEESVFDEA